MTDADETEAYVVVDDSTGEMVEVPKVFGLHVLKAAIERNAAEQIGTKGLAMIAAIAAIWDGIGYRAAARIPNSTLRAATGIKKVHTVNEVRALLVKFGWLKYENHGHQAPGYTLAIPPLGAQRMKIAASETGLRGAVAKAPNAAKRHGPNAAKRHLDQSNGVPPNAAKRHGLVGETMPENGIISPSPSTSPSEEEDDDEDARASDPSSPIAQAPSAPSTDKPSPTEEPPTAELATVPEQHRPDVSALTGLSDKVLEHGWITDQQQPLVRAALDAVKSGTPWEGAWWWKALRSHAQGKCGRKTWPTWCALVNEYGTGIVLGQLRQRVGDDLHADRIRDHLKTRLHDGSGHATCPACEWLRGRARPAIERLRARHKTSDPFWQSLASKLGMSPLQGVYCLSEVLESNASIASAALTIARVEIPAVPDVPCAALDRNDETRGRDRSAGGIR